MLIDPEESFINLRSEQRKLVKSAVTPLPFVACAVEEGCGIMVQIKPGLIAHALFGGDSSNDGLINVKKSLVVSVKDTFLYHYFFVVKTGIKAERNSADVELDLSDYEGNWAAVPRFDPTLGWMLPLGQGLYIKIDLPEDQYMRGAPVTIDKVVTATDGSVSAAVQLSSYDLPPRDICTIEATEAHGAYVQFEYKGIRYAVMPRGIGGFVFFCYNRRGEVIASYASKRFKIPKAAKLLARDDGDVFTNMNLI